MQTSFYFINVISTPTWSWDSDSKIQSRWLFIRSQAAAPGGAILTGRGGTTVEPPAFHPPGCVRKVSERLEAPGEGNIPGGSGKNKCQFLVSELCFYLDHSSYRWRVTETVVPAFACLGTLASSKECLAQRVLTMAAFHDALSLGIPGSRTEVCSPYCHFSEVISFQSLIS